MAEIRDRRATSAYAARLFIAAAAGTCVANATWWMQPVLMNDLAAGPRALGTAGAGLVVSAEMAAMSLGSALLTRIIKPHRLAVPAMVGLFVSILGSVLSLEATGLPALLVSRALAGAGVGASLTMANAVAVHFRDPDKIFARLSLVNLLFGAVLVASVPFAHRMAPGNPSFAAILATFVILVLPTALLPLRLTGGTAPGHDLASTPRMPSAMAKNNVLLLAVVTLLVGLASGTMWAFYGVIGEQIGFTPAEVDGAISTAILAAMGATGLSALIGSRFGRILPTSVALVLMALAISILALEPTRPMFRLATCLNVSCLYFALPYLLGAASAQDPGGRGAAYVGSAFYFTGAVSPTLGGVLAETTGIRVMSVAVIVVVVLVIAAMIRVERRGRLAQV